MSKLSELESQAVKEGITLDEPKSATPSESPKSVETPAESTPASESKDSQVPSPAKTGLESEDNVPFHKHPRFQEVIKKNKEWEGKYSQLEAKIKAQEAYLQQLQSLNQPKGQEIPEEQKQAIIQLARLFKQSPEFQKELGLDRLDELQKQNEALAQARSEESFNKEFEEVLTYGASLGMDKDELKDELLEAVQNHPVYSQIPYSQGLIRAVFRDSKWDKLGELKEREVNAKLIKEQEAKRKSNAESSSPSSKETPKGKEPSMEQFLSRRIKEEGGIII